MGHLPLCFLWSGAIFLPAVRSGKRRSIQPSRRRDLVMGKRCGQVSRGREAQNCNTWPQSAVDESVWR
jgi:hypothetical protein